MNDTVELPNDDPDSRARTLCEQARGQGAWGKKGCKKAHWRDLAALEQQMGELALHEWRKRQSPLAAVSAIENEKARKANPERLEGREEIITSILTLDEVARAFGFAPEAPAEISGRSILAKHQEDTEDYERATLTFEQKVAKYQRDIDASLSDASIQVEASRRQFGALPPHYVAEAAQQHFVNYRDPLVKFVLIPEPSRWERFKGFFTRLFGRS